MRSDARGRVSGGIAGLLIVLVLTLSLTAPAGAQSIRFLGPYGEAMDAVDNGDWNRARELLEQAVAANSESGRYRGAGTRFVSYTPHYFLGLALYRLGDCQAALRAWEAVDPGKLEDLAPSEHERWTELLPECRRQIAVAEEADSLRAEIRRAEEARNRARRTLEANELEELRETDDLRELRAEDTRAATALESAREDLESGVAVGDLERLRAAGRKTASARETWERVLVEAERRIAAIRTAREEEAAAGGTPEPEETDDDPEPPPQEVPVTRLDDPRDDRSTEASEDGDPSPEDPSEDRSAEARVATDDAGGDETVPSETPAESGNADGDSAGEGGAEDQLPWEPPGALREAARAYFELGAYREATRILAEREFTDPRARSRRLLLLAASHHALSTIEADAESEHLEQARRYAAAYASVDRDLASLDSTYFSPRFIRFCRSVRQ